MILLMATQEGTVSRGSNHVIERKRCRLKIFMKMHLAKREETFREWLRKTRDSGDMNENITLVALVM